MTQDDAIRTAQRLSWVRQLVRDGQLRATFEAAGLTSGDFAVLVGASTAAVHTWTTTPPLRTPSRTVALRIADVLEAVGNVPA